MASKITQLHLDQVRLDGATQMRVELDSAVAAEYAEAYQQKEDLPDPVVFHDGSAYWLADGFHRWHGMNQAKIKCASFKVFDGTKRDAFLYAVGTNRAHGLRRRSEDVRYCVRRMLQDEEWGRWSDAEVAKQCRTRRELVADERRKLKEEAAAKQRRADSHLSERSSEDSPPADTRRTYTTKHGTTATMNTAKIGKGQTRERPVYRIDADEEPEAYAKVMAQLARSPKKLVRQAKTAGWTLEETLDLVREAWEMIPVAD